MCEAMDQMEVCGITYTSSGWGATEVDEMIAEILGVSLSCPDGYDRQFGAHGEENLMMDLRGARRVIGNHPANLWYIVVVYPANSHMHIEANCMTTELNPQIWERSGGDSIIVTVVLHHVPLTLESLLSEQYTVPEFTIYVDGVKLDEGGHRAHYWRPR